MKSITSKGRAPLGRRKILLGALGAAAALPAASAARAEAPGCGPDAFAGLPDWSGVWRAVEPMSGLLFDGGRLKGGEDRPRNFPPLKPVWEASYTRFLDEVVKAGKFSDPLTLGLPPGMPRFVSLPRQYQFIVRPEAVWMTHERPDLRTIYTDGRDHPPEEILLNSWMGHSIGRWEADTLVIDTVAMRGGVPIDRTGLVLSGRHRVTERVRKNASGLLVNEVTIDDPVAFTRPWVVVRHYERVKERWPTINDVPSLEFDRNPIVDGETTIILDAVYDENRPYPEAVQPFAAMEIPS
jgi:hypothetical protein